MKEQEDGLTPIRRALLTYLIDFDGNPDASYIQHVLLNRIEPSILKTYNVVENRWDRTPEYAIFTLAVRFYTKNKMLPTVNVLKSVLSELPKLKPAELADCLYVLESLKPEEREVT